MNKSIITFVTLILSQSAIAFQSFDCKLSQTKIEKLICSSENESLQILDGTLSDLYKAQRTLDISNAKDIQLGWLKMRNQCQTVQCLSDIYTQRINALSKSITDSWNPGVCLKDSRVVAYMSAITQLNKKKRKIQFGYLGLSKAEDSHLGTYMDLDSSGEADVMFSLNYSTKNKKSDYIFGTLTEYNGCLIDVGHVGSNNRVVGGSFGVTHINSIKVEDLGYELGKESISFKGISEILANEKYDSSNVSLAISREFYGCAGGTSDIKIFALLKESKRMIPIYEKSEVCGEISKQTFHYLTNN